MIFWSLSRLPPAASEDDLVSESERRIFRSLRSPRRRLEWCAGRRACRRLTSLVLNTPGESTEIVSSPAGLPRARHRDEELPIALSLSHGGDWLLCAARPGPAGAPLGADVEPLIPRRRDALLHALNREETERFAAHDPDRLRVHHLLQLWTIKEAVLKATARGLRLSPRRVSVGAWPAPGSLAPSPVLFDGRAVQVWSLRNEQLALAIGWLGDSSEEISPEPAGIDY